MKKDLELSFQEEIRILRLWAAATDLVAAMPESRRTQVRGLTEALEAASELASTIGWDDDEADAPRADRVEARGSRAGIGAEMAA